VDEWVAEVDAMPGFAALMGREPLESEVRQGWV
jgi:hypothetical protein